LKRKLELKFDNLYFDKMKKITKREIIAFILGILFSLLLEVIFNWDTHVRAFKEGMENAQKSSTTEHLNV